MEIKIGIDLAFVAKIKKLAESSPEFLEEVFTETERSYCLGKKRCFEHLAARFAAKEAFFKAIGTGIGGGIGWKEIEVRNHFRTGRPYLNLAGKAEEMLASRQIVSVDLSLSHTEELAIAQVALLLE
ncbi:holo-ACP synthase [Brevibacillus fulvus]|uniref:Holo-[acyl-carrier-protein] synthase n=1 Tax=Brevibacillus fulvus TaxID=1125967 RepID=A0A938XWS4_9BACL|nr:holo-ACP synthase [Brevibacillus fulvus]MBM7589554.1 holo-[acyl-carrier protein] synthase [Brevibacillus fulvus]